MTKKRAERLTGYKVRELPPERGLFTVDAFEGEGLVVKAIGRADFIAFQALVNGVLFFNSRKAMEQHGWRCARCRVSRRLEIHHRKYRSHARVTPVLVLPGTTSDGMPRKCSRACPWARSHAQRIQRPMRASPRQKAHIS